MSHFTNITWGASNVPATVNAPMQELSDAIDSHDHAGGDGAQIDHGGLAGIADDDHTQYHTDGRAASWHTAIGDSSPHHAAVSLATSGDSLLGLTGQQISLDTQVANRVLAGPSTGADAAPTFRSLVASDLPAIDHGGLGGLSDDDHTQYLLATGARTGASSSAQIFTNGIVGPSWKPSTDSTTALQMKNAAGTAIITLDTSTGLFTLVSLGTTAATEYMVGRFIQTSSSKGINFGYYVSPGGTVQEARLRSVANTPLAIGTTSYPQAIYILDSSGYIGLGGATAPAAPLEILRTGNSVVEALRLTNTTNDSGGPGSYIAFHNHETYTADAARIVGARVINSGSQGYLGFFTRRDGSTITEKLRLGYLGLALGDSYISTNPPADGMIIQGQVGIGVTSPGTMLNVLATDATTGSVTDVLTVGHNVTSGTPSDGFGSGTVFKLNSSTTASQTAALIKITWATADHANRKAQLTISVYDTAAREGLRVQANGSAALIGFYGVAAVARATTGGSAATFVQNSGNAVNDASTFDGYTLGQVVTALRNIGVLT